MTKFSYLAMLAFAISGVCQTQAREIKAEPKLSEPAKRVSVPAPSKAIETTPNRIWYGYYKGNEPIAAMGLGYPDMESMVNNAIFINGADPMYEGKTIKGLRFRIQGKGDIDNISAWLSTELNIPVDQDLLVSVPVDESQVADTVWTEVALPEGFVIPKEGVYAGYTVHTNSKIRTSQFVGFTTSDRIAPEGALYNYETPLMSGWQSYGDRMGKLCYQVLLEGDFYANALTVKDFGKHYAVTGEESQVNLTVSNLGSAGVETIDYVVVTNGIRGEEKHLVLPEKFNIFGGSFNITIPLSADKETRLAEKEIIITKVNGVENESSDNVAKGSLVTLLSKVDRKAVAETYTGTWCGWCPRAIVGNQRLKELFGDKFISIEAHVGMRNNVEPMAIAAYEEIKDDLIGYPTSFFNREMHGDPYTGLSRQEVFLSPELVETVLDGVAEGEISVAAEWGNVDKTRIKVNADVTLMYDTDDVHYGIAYVVKADGLSGKGNDWLQSNFYASFAEESQYAPDTELGIDFDFFLHSPEYIPDMVYDDVAVAAYGLASGLPGSVATPAIAGVKGTSEYTISIANNNLITDKEKLKIVAMLIDTESGRIVNVDECALGNVGIDSIDGNGIPYEIGRFDIMGMSVSDNHKGIVIVTYSDGSVRKIVLK